MKHAAYLFLFVVLILVSCKNPNTTTAKNINLPPSYGDLNTLSVIVNDSLWRGKVGETLREELASPVKGLPQEEPIFSITHIPPAAFLGSLKTTRIFVKITPHTPSYFKMVSDTFAYPQMGIFIGGKDASTLQNIVRKNAGKMIRALKQTEIEEAQQQMKQSLKETDTIQKMFGIRMQIPSTYHIAQSEKGFIRVQRELARGSMGILIYQVPLKTIDTSDNVVRDIIKMRDSIGKKYINRPEKGTYMMTGRAYAPFLYETTVNGKFTYLTKGIWKISNNNASGPFINYAIYDKKNNRYLVLEGFLYKPQAPAKRDNMFALKAIIHATKIL